jgi:hypothetical protein
MRGTNMYRRKLRLVVISWFEAFPRSYSERETECDNTEECRGFKGRRETFFSFSADAVHFSSSRSSEERWRR